MRRVSGAALYCIESDEGVCSSDDTIGNLAVEESNTVHQKLLARTQEFPKNDWSAVHHCRCHCTSHATDPRSMADTHWARNFWVQNSVLGKNKNAG